MKGHGPKIDLSGPVEVGEEIEVKIEKITAKGEGFGLIDKNYGVFVEQNENKAKLKAGDVVKVRIIELAPSFATGGQI
jgi:predicted RNA-binding protein with TRAM domain